LIRKLSNLEQKANIELNTKCRMVSSVMRKEKTRIEMVTMMGLMLKLVMRLESRKILKTG
jgi:hypothetical protein